MADIEYPTSLPRPQASLITPPERRALSDPQRPRDARALERDRREFEQITWPALTSAQVAALDSWWRTTLIFGGAWFAARWPLPRGFVSAVRKFDKQPKWVYVGNGFWRVTAVCEVRGQGTPTVNDDPWGTPDSPFPGEALIGLTYRPAFADMEYAAEYVAAGFPDATDIGGSLDATTAGSNVDLDAGNGNLNPYFTGIGTVLSTATVLDGSKRQLIEAEITLLVSGARLAVGAWKSSGPAYDAEAGFGGSSGTSVTNGGWLRSDGVFVPGFGFPGDIGFELQQGDVIGMVDNFGELEFFVNGSAVTSLMFITGSGCKVMLSCYEVP